MVQVSMFSGIRFMFTETAGCTGYSGSAGPTAPLRILNSGAIKVIRHQFRSASCCRLRCLVKPGLLKGLAARAWQWIHPRVDTSSHQADQTRADPMPTAAASQVPDQPMQQDPMRYVHPPQSAVFWLHYTGFCCDNIRDTLDIHRPAKSFAEHPVLSLAQFVTSGASSFTDMSPVCVNVA